MKRNSLLNSGWFLWPALFLIPPVGIILVWLNKSYSNAFKIIITFLFCVYLIITLVVWGRIGGKLAHELFIIF